MNEPFNTILKKVNNEIGKDFLKNFNVNVYHTDNDHLVSENWKYILARLISYKRMDEISIIELCLDKLNIPKLNSIDERISWLILMDL